jgi:catechol 2,3-dioxygenase-like lactoylglutathione lyase family enzyme
VAVRLRRVITAIHTLVYSEDAAATRAFFRDVLGFPNVDAHDGWLIFGSGPSELAVHPAGAPSHEITLMCDDIEKTMAELSDKGVEFDGGITDAGFGRTTHFAVPGAGSMMLYQPRHPVAYDL